MKALKVSKDVVTLPNRIDLGLGRAPGTDPRTAQALARSASDAQSFAENIYDLQGWFGPEGMPQSSRIISAPSAGTDVPIWVLGSTTEGASIAGQLGLPFAVASHFAPDQLYQAIEVYRKTFNTKAPTARLEKPHLMVAINVMTCEDSAEAHRQFTSIEQRFASLRRLGAHGKVPHPEDDLETTGTPKENAMARSMLRVKAVGNPDQVTQQLSEIVNTTQADEIITTTWSYDPKIRLRSLELTAKAWLN